MNPAPIDPPVARRPAHIPQLDGLRAVAATYVLGHHAYLQAWPVDYAIRPTGPLGPAVSWLAYGRSAVVLFIVLSGFCLALPVVSTGGLRGGARRFLLGRFWRIVPPYYASIALSVGLIWLAIGRPTGTHWDGSVLLSWRAVLVCLAFVPDLLATGAINHVYWSVAVEAKIYLIYPLIVAAWRRLGVLAAGLIVAALALGLWRLSRGQWIFAKFIPLFLMGVIAAVVATSDDPRWRRWRGLPWAAICLVGCTPLVAQFGLDNFAARPRKIPAMDMIAGQASACGLIALVARPGRAARLLASRPMVFVGTFAYSLYLIHAPLLQLIHQYLVFPLHLTRSGQFLALVGVGHPLILVAAYGFYRACERPFLPRRRLPDRAEAVPMTEVALAPLPEGVANF